MNNVSQLFQPSLDQLGERCDAAIDTTVSSRAEWVNASLEIASCFAEARSRFNKMLFTEWLDKGKRRGVSREDRLAFIGLGGDLNLAREVLEKTTRNSYQYIWKEEKHRFPAKEDVRQVTHISSVRKKKQAREPKPKKLSNNPPGRPWGERNPLFSLPRGEEINSTHINKNAVRGIDTLMKKYPDEGIWDMIVQCYDAGFLRDTSYYWNLGKNGIPLDVCSLKFLFPRAEGGFAARNKLDSERSLKHIREIIIPAALESRDEILSYPGNLESVVKKYWRTKAGDTDDDFNAEEARVKTKKPPAQEKTERRETASVTAGSTYKHLTRQQVDPEFEGSEWEWINKYGHVQAMTAEQYASVRFSSWAGHMRSLVKSEKALPPLPERPVDHNWLRNPKPYDIEKLSEALAHLRPLIAEAEALLITATAALEKKKA